MESEGEEGDGEGGRLSSVMTEGDDGLDSSSISRLRKLLIWPDLNSDGISPFASSLCATGDLGDVDAMAAKRRMIFFFGFGSESHTKRRPSILKRETLNI